MSLRQEIFSARDNAMKTKDTAALSTLRILSSDIKNAEIVKQSELNDTEVLAVIAKQVKQLKDAAKEFAAGGRDDLVTQNNEEIALLSAYLPAELSDAAIQEHIDATLAELGDDADMGKAMAAVMKRVAGQADGARVRALLQQSLH
ncbi:MAG: glutamyl-tRNA amidotransferase [Candidatus Magasanikbacteria bacterium CG10_big_fil_rev_8_21_14_0_10_43_6]|uniref:Glutamyl-tRNA amidotransferase n=1 Tax=Candidatus Magasanikbacteria bacterium CG10_big_fil_rev_8_21_14_0_10_43_6 TaxID=1974650 RepID=A0A2M6W2A9_9BACT|nr:MAG: glutamyl-tRNA amidotransferase [Candidatus Magasanikbacteria bacterium CG10_big_fil_rev_8_21_14_0_10_43_6]